VSYKNFVPVAERRRELLFYAIVLLGKGDLNETYPVFDVDLPHSLLCDGSHSRFLF
jgi:hypothetical protein